MLILSFSYQVCGVKSMTRYKGVFETLSKISDFWQGSKYDNKILLLLEKTEKLNFFVNDATLSGEKSRRKVTNFRG